MATATWPIVGGSGGITIYPNTGDFPASPSVVGQQAVAADSVPNIWEWDGTSWVLATGGASLTLGNLTISGAGSGLSIGNGTNAVVGTGTTISQTQASASNPGWLSAADWSTFNSKQGTLTLGNIADSSAGADGITITGGMNAVIGTGVIVVQHVADATHPGYMSAQAQILGGIKTFAAAPVFSSVTAGQALIVDGGKSLTSIGYGSALAVSTLVARDSSGNSFDNNFSSANAILAATGGSPTYTFTAASPRVSLFVGSGTATVNLPDATTLIAGMVYEVSNTTGAAVITVKLNGAGTLATVNPGAYLIANLEDNSTSAGTWAINWLLPAGSSGASISIGAFGSTPNANGLSLSGTALSMQPADASHPGGVSTTTQTFGGLKTFGSGVAVSGSMVASGIISSGTAAGIGVNGELDLLGSATGTVSILVQAAAGTYNFNLPTTPGTAGQVLTSQGGGSTAMTWGSGGGGGVSIGTFGSSPNSSGLTLTGSVLNMEPADLTHPGGISTSTQSFGGTKTFTNLVTNSITTTESTFGVAGVIGAAANGNALILQGNDGVDYAQLRITHNTGAWADSVITSYFQIKNDNNFNTTFMGGTAASDAQMDRLQFCSAYTTIIDDTFNAAAIPTHILEVQSSLDPSKPVLSLLGAFGQTGNFLNITSLGSGAGNLFNVDPAGNSHATNYVGGYTTTATGGGTTILSVSSTYQQYFTGSTTQDVQLPITSTLVLGHSFRIVNLSSGAVNVNSSGSNLIGTLSAGSVGIVTCISTSGTSAASWSLSTSSGGGVLAIADGGTGVTSVTTVPTATSFAGWDANLNLSANNFIPGQSIVTSAAQTISMTVSSAYSQILVGTSFCTFELPVVSTLVLGQEFQFINVSSGSLNVHSSGGNLIGVFSNGTGCIVSCVSLSGTGAGSWVSVPLGSPATYTGYGFLCSPATATTGATYTNNGNTYTVLSSIAVGTVLYTSQSAVPSSSGSLIKATGTGDPTITYSSAFGISLV